MRKLPLVVLLGVLVLAAAPAAAADPTPEDRAIARTLFDDGRNLAKAGRWREACAKLEASQKAAPGIGTLFNLADCYEHLGKTASAWSAFLAVADESKRAAQPDRETIARDRANALAAKLSKMRIDAKAAPPTGLELRLDGKPLDLAVIGAELPVDPGDHKLTVSAPGKATKEVAVKIEVTGSILLVDLPVLDAGTGPPPPPPPPPGDDTGPPPQHDERTWQKPAAYVAGGLTIVALGVGTFFGLRASSQWSDAKSTCPDACDDASYASWQDSRSSAKIGTIGFISAGVLAAAAVVLFVTAPKSSSAASTSRALRGFAGLAP